MRGAGARSQEKKAENSFISGRTLRGGPCRIGAWKRVWSCKAGKLARPSWSRCGDCWRPIPIGAGLGSRANRAWSGTGATTPAISRTWPGVLLEGEIPVAGSENLETWVSQCPRFAVPEAAPSHLLNRFDVVAGQVPPQAPVEALSGSFRTPPSALRPAYFAAAFWISRARALASLAMATACFRSRLLFWKIAWMSPAISVS